MEVKVQECPAVRSSVSVIRLYGPGRLRLPRHLSALCFLPHYSQGNVQQCSSAQSSSQISTSGCSSSPLLFNKSQFERPLDAPQHPRARSEDTLSSRPAPTDAPSPSWRGRRHASSTARVPIPKTGDVGKRSASQHLCSRAVAVDVRRGDEGIR